MQKKLNQILKMKNPIMPYAWGSHSAIAELRKEASPTAAPQAELWMGAHPKAPSEVFYQGRWQPLDRLIQQMPEQLLGREISAAYGANLPFLFKILAAEQPLSIQAHPSGAQAKAGFARENAAGIPLSAGHRNYKDDQPKPECICALTPFWGVCGFRRPEAIGALLGPVLPDRYRSVLDPLLKAAAAQALEGFFNHLMTLPRQQRLALVSEVARNCRLRSETDSAYEWVTVLNAHYPGDAGALSPLYLNLFCLQPGQALFLPAGCLHAYFKGMGIEIMVNSDNVLRGGLTPKHIDVAELMAILDFTPTMLSYLKPVPDHPPYEHYYPSETQAFALSVISLPDNDVYRSPKKNRRAPRILLCTQGSAAIACDPSSCEPVLLSPGDAALVPADVCSYTISGPAVVYKASMP